MFTRNLVAALSLLALPAAAQKVTETTLPLADPEARAFAFVGNLALAIDYNGGGKVTARINAYDLSRSAFAWRQEIRVQDTDKNPGAYLTSQSDINRLYFGNGPLTAVEATTGRILWSLDCKTAGSVDLKSARSFADGLLLRGTQGCGDLDRVRVLRVDPNTGAVRWTADAEVHTYKTGKDNQHSDFVMYWEHSTNIGDLARLVSEGDSAAVDQALAELRGGAPPAQVILAGERLQAVDYATGNPAWSVKEKPGRWVPFAPQGLSLWADDDKLVAYSTRDGSKQWAYPLDAPWAFVFAADSTPTSDIVAVTWKGAHRIDRSGHAKWTFKRDDNTWGQAFLPPVVMVATKSKHWAAIDLATGQVCWTAKVDGDGDMRRVVEDLSPATGVVLIEGYDDGTKSLSAFDIVSGRLLWKKERGDRGANLLGYAIRGGSHLTVNFDGKPLSEVDVRTGAVTGVVTAAPTAAAPEVSPLLRALRLRFGTGAYSDDGYHVEYDDEVLTCRNPNGQTVWTRKGEKSTNARIAIMSPGIVVWATKDGKVELIGLASGTSLYTATGNAKPAVGVDAAHGRVLIPSGKTLKVLTMAGTT